MHLRPPAPAPGPALAQPALPVRGDGARLQMPAHLLPGQGPSPPAAPDPQTGGVDDRDIIGTQPEERCTESEQHYGQAEHYEHARENVAAVEVVVVHGPPRRHPTTACNPQEDEGGPLVVPVLVQDEPVRAGRGDGAGPGTRVPGRNGGHGPLHALMRPALVVRVAHEAGQLDPLALHRDDGQEERLQVEDAYKVSQRDDGDGEVAAHLVPAQRPGPPPRADADPTGVHVQTLTMAQDEDNPDEAADHQGDDLDQQHDRPDAEPVVGPLLEERGEREIRYRDHHRDHRAEDDRPHPHAGVDAGEDEGLGVGQGRSPAGGWACDHVASFLSSAEGTRAGRPAAMGPAPPPRKPGHHRLRPRAEPVEQLRPVQHRSSRPPAADRPAAGLRLGFTSGLSSRLFLAFSGQHPDRCSHQHADPPVVDTMSDSG